MPSIAPRKTEVEAIVTLLEADHYDSADALAKDIIKRTYELFLEREWYVALYRFGSGDPTLSWGPFPSDNEAAKFAAKVAVAGPGRHGVLHLHSVGQQERIDAEQIALTSPKLCQCDHPKYMHEHEGYAGKCAVQGCRCKKYR